MILPAEGTLGGGAILRSGCCAVSPSLASESDSEDEDAPVGLPARCRVGLCGFAVMRFGGGIFENFGGGIVEGVKGYQVVGTR